MFTVKVVYLNVLSPYSNGRIPKEKIGEEDIDQDTTIQELFDLSQEGCADITKYYNLSSSYYFNNRTLPYICSSERKVIWGPAYEKIKVLDFIKTHNIKNNTILADTGIPQAGGPDFKDLVQLWNECYPIIDQFSSIFGLGGSLIGIGKWIKSLFIKKKGVPPQSIFDFLLSRNKWNHYELAEMLEIKDYEAKKLLRAFGYKWDSSMKVYIQQSNTKEIIKKLSEVSIYKHD